MIKGLLLRHMRWWLRQPIFTDSGLLTIGYAYPNLNMAEQYNSSGSPYWSLKAFLPLALPNEHPFWSAPEQALPDLPSQVLQPHARMILCRDNRTDHVFALTGGQWATWGLRHVAEKYAKFCYSNHFGFSIPCASTGLEFGAHDNMLALSDDELHFRVRRVSENVKVTDQAVYSLWRPWPDVLINTWLIPAGAGHIRVHLVKSERGLVSAEGGFAVSCSGDDRQQAKTSWRCRKGMAQAAYRAGNSLIRDLLGKREGRIVSAAPNTNLLHPRTVIPTMLGKHDPGEFWLASAVRGIPGTQWGTVVEDWSPTMSLTPSGFTVSDSHNKVLYDHVLK